MSRDASPTQPETRITMSDYKRKLVPFLKEDINDHRFLQKLDIENLKVQEEVAMTLKRTEIANETATEDNFRKVHKLVSSRIVRNVKDDQNRVDKWKLLRGELYNRQVTLSLAHQLPEFDSTSTYLQSQKDAWRNRASRHRLQTLKSKIGRSLYEHAKRTTDLSIPVSKQD